MAKQTINIGAKANDGNGDPLRVAFDKINDNFDELYEREFKGDINGSIFSDDSTLLVDAVNSTFNLDGTIKGNIIPDEDSKYDLGSSTNRFKDLYLSGNTLDLGGLKLRYRDNGLQVAVDLVVGEPLYPPADGVASSEWFDNTGIPFFYNYDENGQIIGDLDDAENTDVCRDADGNPTAFIQINYFGPGSGATGDSVGTLDAVLNLKAGNGHSLVDPDDYGFSGVKLYGGATWPIELTHTGDPVYHPYPKFKSGPGSIPPTPQSIYEQDPDRGYIIIPVNLSPKQAGMIESSSPNTSTFIYAHAFPVETPLGGGVIKDEEGVSLVDTKQSTINAEKLVGTIPDNVIPDFINADLKGNVFANDSSLLVDAVNGNIPGYISLADLKAEVALSIDFADFKARIAAL